MPDEEEGIICPFCFAYFHVSKEELEDDELICPVCRIKISEEDIENVLTEDTTQPD